jgi:putative phage-type endonuclease
MKIIDCVQGTPEWFSARCGIPSASNFDKIITMDGKPSKQRTKYLYQLAGERLAGKPEETYTNGAMQRGKELEAEARKLYQIVTGNEVQEVGFCLAEGYGASPDGLVGQDGSLEIKCPIISTHVGYLLEKVVPSDYFQQTQGQLLVTGRSWVDFVSYYPGIKPLIIRAERDEKFIAALKTELVNFCEELNDISNRIGR